MKHLISSTILLRCTVFIFSFWVYISIIIDILKGFQLTILLNFPSSREIIFDFLEEGDWLFDVWYRTTLVNNVSSYIILIVEIIISIGGLMLFLLSLFNSFRAKRANIKIANLGPYKFIRHPQNIGILLTTFPCVLYVPGSDDTIGIQIGGILLRLLFILCMIVHSDLQELNMQRKSPEEFSAYRKSVGFFFPKIRRNHLKKKEKKKNYFLRYYTLFLGYFFTILIIEVIIHFLLFMEIGIFIIYL